MCHNNDFDRTNLSVIISILSNKNGIKTIIVTPKPCRMRWVDLRELVRAEFFSHFLHEGSNSNLGKVTQIDSYGCL